MAGAAADEGSLGLTQEAAARIGACFGSGAVAGRGREDVTGGAGAENATSVEATDFEPGPALGWRAPPPEAEGADNTAAEAGRELGRGSEAGRSFCFAMAAAVGSCAATLQDAAASHNMRATRWLVQWRMMKETEKDALLRGPAEEL